MLCHCYAEHSITFAILNGCLRCFSIAVPCCALFWYAIPLRSAALRSRCNSRLRLHCRCAAVLNSTERYNSLPLLFNSFRRLALAIQFGALPLQNNALFALLHHSCVWHWNASPCHCVASRFFAMPPLYDTTPFRAIARLSQTKHFRGVARTSYAIELNAICI